MFVRVVLDTCTVRNHTDDCQPQIDVNLLQERRDGVRLSLSASAFVELTRQLADGDLPYARWKEKSPSINAILDPRWPCLPNGKQLAWLAGTQTHAPIESLEDESRHMRPCWFHLLDVAPAEIGKCQVVYRVSNGTLKSIRLDATHLRNVIASQRQEWIDYIQNMQKELPGRGFRAKDEDAILDLMRSDFGSDTQTRLVSWISSTPRPVCSRVSWCARCRQRCLPTTRSARSGEGTYSTWTCSTTFRFRPSS